MGYFQATAEANNLAAVADAKSVYTSLMEEMCGGGQPYLGEGHLVAEHFRIRDKAIFQVTSSIETCETFDHRQWCLSYRFYLLCFPIVHVETEIGRRGILPNLFTSTRKGYRRSIH